MMQLNTEINKVLKYFSIFAYHPTLEEIHTFLKVKISKNELEKELKRIKYTPPQYSIPTSPRLRGVSKYQISHLRQGYGGQAKVKNNNEAMKQWNNLIKKQQISKDKLNSIKFKLYIKLISFFPQIRLVGLSGSISMMNAGENDDIDLFIITAKKRLFTGRFIALTFAQILGLRRYRQTEKLDTIFFDRLTPKGPQAIVSKKVSSLSYNNETMKQSNNGIRNKVCLNLFFDERDLKVPRFKQTEFVGHEVLQMKPVIVKGDIYERFLEANGWVFRLFPNASRVIPAKAGIQTKYTFLKCDYRLDPLLRGDDIFHLTFNFVESIFKKFQLNKINKHRTTEIITPSQLWFHPNDYNSFM